MRGEDEDISSGLGQGSLGRTLFEESRSGDVETSPERGQSETGRGGVSQILAVSAAKLFHRRVAAMRHVVLRDMRVGTYVPVVDEGSARCRESLGWWKGEQ